MPPTVQSDVKMNSTTMLKATLERYIEAKAKRT